MPAILNESGRHGVVATPKSHSGEICWLLRQDKDDDPACLDVLVVRDRLTKTPTGQGRRIWFRADQAPTAPWALQLPAGCKPAANADPAVDPSKPAAPPTAPAKPSTPPKPGVLYLEAARKRQRKAQKKPEEGADEGVDDETVPGSRLAEVVQPPKQRNNKATKRADAAAASSGAESRRLRSENAALKARLDSLESVISMLVQRLAVALPSDRPSQPLPRSSGPRRARPTSSRTHPGRSNSASRCRRKREAVSSVNRLAGKSIEHNKEENAEGASERMRGGVGGLRDLCPLEFRERKRERKREEYEERIKSATNKGRSRSCRVRGGACAGTAVKAPLHFVVRVRKAHAVPRGCVCMQTPRTLFFSFFFAERALPPLFGVMVIRLKGKGRREVPLFFSFCFIFFGFFFTIFCVDVWLLLFFFLSSSSFFTCLCPPPSLADSSF